MAAQTGHDPGYTALSRHLYWALEGGSGQAIGARHAREQLMAFAWRMRVDEGLPIPMGEAHLTSHLRWRRRWKSLVFGGTRFAFRRYDRLLSELAELTAVLAERVVELEVEAEHLREKLASPESKDGSR